MAAAGAACRLLRLSLGGGCGVCLSHGGGCGVCGAVVQVPVLVAAADGDGTTDSWPEGGHTAPAQSRCCGGGGSAWLVGARARTGAW